MEDKSKNTQFVESPTVELQREYTTRSLRTVSAFANLHGGILYFGIADNGTWVGIQDIPALRLTIENAVNNTFDPVPHYTFEVLTQGDLQILAMQVAKGERPPYLYRQIAYTRHDTSNVPMKSAEQALLIKSVMPFQPDSELSLHNDLVFDHLASQLQDVFQVSALSQDYLTMLGLKQNGNYKFAAELFADNNPNRHIATDIAVFGDTQNEIIDRTILANMSLVQQFLQAQTMFNRYYSPIEIIDGMYRREQMLIPELAFREAVLNALIHRDYTMLSAVQIGMHPDRIEIVSPGGLPKGKTKRNLLLNSGSQCRNQLVAHVFFRLNLIEQFGTGINRLFDAYQGYSVTPLFTIDQHNVTVTLPVLTKPLTEIDKQKMLHQWLIRTGIITRVDLEQFTKLRKSAAGELLQQLVAQGAIVQQGNGKNTKYKVANSLEY